MSDSFRYFVGNDLGSTSHQTFVCDAQGQQAGEREVAYLVASIAALLDWIGSMRSLNTPIPLPSPLPPRCRMELWWKRFCKEAMLSSRSARNNWTVFATASPWREPRTIAATPG